jgi:membrane associated rhomboid family serine protease
MISITAYLVGITCVVSILAFNDSSFKYKLTYSPYAVKHHKKWWQVFSHGFVHADYMHLAFNMFTLYFLGTGEKGVEAAVMQVFGTKGYLVYFLLYFGGMAFASLPSIMKHHDNPGYLAVGASGAVSAIVFAFILFRPVDNLLIYGLIPVPGVILGVLYLAFETYANKKNQTNVAHDAHIAGAIFGVLFLILMEYRLIFHFIDEIKNKISGF